MKYAQCIDTTVIVGPLISATDGYASRAARDTLTQHGLEIANNIQFGRDTALPTAEGVRFALGAAIGRLFT